MRTGKAVRCWAEGEADRARGCLLGLAVGDALGTTLEFAPRDALPLHTEMAGGGPFGLAPGQWTDDTAMALALAESLIERGCLNTSDLMNRFVAWWQAGAYSCTGRCFDIGLTTRRALVRFLRTPNPCCGDTDERSAGNGSLMRLAPAALFAVGKGAATAAHLARVQSRTTHGAPQAVEACALLATLLREAVLGGSKEDVLAPRAWDGHPAIAAVAASSWRGKARGQIRSTGYVVDTLEAALWAVARTDTFEDALVLAVNLGGDADTVGAVAGQLAGALHGAAAIPPRWLASLAWRARIEAIAAALVSAGRRPRPAGAKRGRRVRFVG